MQKAHDPMSLNINVFVLQLEVNFATLNKYFVKKEINHKANQIRGSQNQNQNESGKRYLLIQKMNVTLVSFFLINLLRERKSK